MCHATFTSATKQLYATSCSDYSWVVSTESSAESVLLGVHDHATVMSLRAASGPLRRAVMRRLGCNVPSLSFSTTKIRKDEFEQEPQDSRPDTPLRLHTWRGSEHISFDPKFILQEASEERKTYSDLVGTYGEHLVARPLPEEPEREFLISRDPTEWRFVERLLPLELVPPVPERSEYPSGFVPVRAKPGEHPYFVRRTVNHMLPVYTKYTRKTNILVTFIRRADGNLFALRDDLDQFLMKRYNLEFISQVAEVYGKVTYRGYFEEDFKDFLLTKGF